MFFLKTNCEVIALVYAYKVSPNSYGSRLTVYMYAIFVMFGAFCKDQILLYIQMEDIV